MLILKIIELSAEEHELLEHPAIAGVILFSCNYEDPSRLRSLTSKIKKNKYFIVVYCRGPREGGRVQRFREGFTDLPNMRHFGQIYSSDPEQEKTALQRKLPIT